MRKTALLLALVFCSSLDAQTTIEGFWQDVAGRTTFKRGVDPASSYGSWYERDLDVTYPHAKHIRKSDAGYDLADLNFDEKEYSIKVLSSDASRIVFVRKAGWSACRAEYACRLEGDAMACAVQTLCREADRDVLDWKGDERYVRRTHCERDGSVQAQGFPVKCR